MTNRIYLDNSATTPVDPRVRAAVQPYLDVEFGNPSSLHAAGRAAHAAVARARQQVAGLLNAHSDEIVFTSSGTESDNTALVGVAETYAARNCHIITSAIEHAAILETCSYLGRRGYQYTVVPAGQDGIVDPQAIKAAIRPNTRLISVMTANNVVGSLQPINEIGQIAHEHGALFHTDAVQAAGKLPIDTQKQPIDLLSLSAHKLHGIKGTGALYVRRNTRLEPLLHGGGQESGWRAATENVPGIVALGCAAEIAQSEMADEAAGLAGWRDRIIDTITRLIPNAYLHGHRRLRLPGHVCFGFAGQEGDAIKLLLALDEQGICVGSGSACSSGHANEPSYVLLGMGLDPQRARGSLRITLGRFNTAADVDRLLAVLPATVASLDQIGVAVA